MNRVLKNENIELCIDDPIGEYNFSRFDWTGKITSLKYKGVLLTSSEKPKGQFDNIHGRGFYNEFGINAAIGFDDIAQEECFLKIGIGQLQKQGETYDFSHDYRIEPANFQIKQLKNSVLIVCNSVYSKDYSYKLSKEIQLLERGFKINYHLQNNGQKRIKTNEYCHNFVAIDSDQIGPNYELNFHFGLDDQRFDKIVNVERKVSISRNKITFTDSPKEQFFFGNLAGGQEVGAYWELINFKKKIGISETGSFKTNKVNLWGWKHVVCPELFVDIDLAPAESMIWSRTYFIFDVE